MLHKDAFLLVKTFHKRQVLFVEQESVDLFDAILESRRKGVDFDSSMELYGSMPLGDALVRVGYFGDLVHWDMVLQYHLKDKKYVEVRRIFEFSLLLKGLVLERGQDIEGRIGFLKVLCPYDKLSVLAEVVQMALPLRHPRFDSFKLSVERVRSKKILGMNFDRWIQIDQDAELCVVKGRFSRAKLDCFLLNPVNSKLGILEKYNLFSSAQRIFLVHGLMTRVKIFDVKGRRKDLDALVEDGVYNHYFALHDGSALGDASNLRAVLYRTWRGWLKHQPIHDIRSYFGERIAFHFAWLGHYTYWLLLSGVFGLIVFVYGVGSAIATPKSSKPLQLDAHTFSLIFDNVLTLPFAFFISVWGILYVQFWSRRNKYLVSQWNPSGFFGEEQSRARWYGTTQRANPVTGKLEAHFPSHRRIFLKTVTLFVLILMLGIVILNVAFYVVYSIWIARRLTENVSTLQGWAGGISSTISLITIIVLRPLCRWISRRLNDMENHKTPTQYQNHLIAKYLLFDFVTFYGITIYVAVVTTWLSHGNSSVFGDPNLKARCFNDSCMMELTMHLTIIFVGRSAFYHVMNYFEPFFSQVHDAYKFGSIDTFISNYKRQRQARLEHIQWCHSTAAPQLQADIHLTNVDCQNTELDGYNAATVQFGFIVLFSVAFPLAPALAAFHNIIQRKIDAYNLLIRYKRPFALQSLGIGVWESWLTYLSYFGVAINAFIISFTSRYFRDNYLGQFGQGNEWVSRLTFMLIFEHAVLAVGFLVSAWFSNPPRKVRCAVQRKEYVEQLLRGKVANDDADPILLHLETIKCK